MTERGDFGRIVAAWAQAQPSVSGLALIGSRTRPEANRVEAADPQSDWDFHVITTDVKAFLGRDWARGLPGAELRAYSVRTTRVGRVPKVNAVFAGAEADFVIIPARPVRWARRLAALGYHRRNGAIRRMLQDLAIVVRPGWRFLKDTGGWDAFYRFAVAAVPDPRLDDGAVLELAEAYVCDYVWAVRKIARGELRAAQRMLHRELAEANFRLLHELRLRRGERSFPEARRIERIAAPEELDEVTVNSGVEGASLVTAVDKSAASFRRLVAGLVGDRWRWPL